MPFVELTQRFMVVPHYPLPPSYTNKTIVRNLFRDTYISSSFFLLSSSAFLSASSRAWRRFSASLFFASSSAAFASNSAFFGAAGAVCKTTQTLLTSGSWNYVTMMTLKVCVFTSCFDVKLEALTCDITNRMIILGETLNLKELCETV